MNKPKFQKQTITNLFEHLYHVLVNFRFREADNSNWEANSNNRQAENNNRKAISNHQEANSNIRK